MDSSLCSSSSAVDTRCQGVKSNILQAPPFTKPELLFEDVHFNPFVVQVMNA